MFESIINYVEKEDFSLTIFYDILSPYLDLTFESTIQDIYKKQSVFSVDDIKIQSLNWREVLAVFTAIYHYDNNLKYPSQKNSLHTLGCEVTTHSTSASTGLLRLRRG